MVQALMKTYNRLPVSFTRGDGAWLWAADGKCYLDAVSGVAVNGLGHGHPKLVEALRRQVGRLIHVSNLYDVTEQQELAELLVDASGMAQAFFCNSGCEAVECAIKLARLYGHHRGILNPQIVVMDGAFHGRTLASLSATANLAYQKGFEPLVAGFIRVPFGDLAAVETAAAEHSNIVAILVELIQGEGGIRVCSAAYLQGLRALCDRRDWLLMYDEAQTGVGRTGRYFGFQHTGIAPDIMMLAKGLASGIPMGACMAAGPASDLFEPGSHGSTFGGNPLACISSIVTFQALREEKLLDNAARQGSRIREALGAALSKTKGILDIRGLGLMIGIELDRPCRELVHEALAAGLLVNVTAGHVIRLLPPLIINDDEADEIVSRLVPVVERFLSRSEPEPSLAQFVGA
jgi:acetylornithine/N-succinyldiaminopimelate aminotransferase